MRKIILASTAAALISAAVPAAAQDTGSRQTREFVQAAAQSDQFEILEAQTVLTQSKDPRVLAFAQQMIRDHTATSQALRQATASAGLKSPPMAMGDDQAHMLGALQSLRGPDFDKAYVKQQAFAHRSALLVEQNYASSGDNPSLRQVASAATPAIGSHLAMAEQMRTAMGGS